jgi:tetratricopeptide (TPR) repeat protein
VIRTRVLALLLAMWVVPVLAQPSAVTSSLTQDCGNVFDAPLGPWDYNDAANAFELNTINKNHFPSYVEGLERGKSSVNAMDDIAFVLRYFPNHHRALNAVARYDVERGIPAFHESWLTGDCWFQRALQFRPKDGVVWLVFANYKARKDQREEALEAYQQALELLGENPEVHYNMGLLYVKLGQYEKALEHARKAYEGNYPLQGLRRKLADKGYAVAD